MEKLKYPVIVTSNVKKQVKLLKGFNTSKETIDTLNVRVHSLLTQATENAAKDGRKTVMARDFEGL